MSLDLLPEAARLLRFNGQLLDQALSLVVAHQQPGAPPFAAPVGAHLRHVIEHYEALLIPRQPGIADYDGRCRDREVERSPQAARARLQALQQGLQLWRDASLAEPVQVRGLGGLAGEFGFDVPSTFGRELAFVASHTVHHFALLKAHCLQHGIAVAADFGKAAATAAHERASAASHPLVFPLPLPFPVTLETPCRHPLSVA
jgi:hypothetical protein